MMNLHKLTTKRVPAVLLADVAALTATDSSNGTASWWFCSPSYNTYTDSVSVIDEDGHLDNGSINCGIRPACWVNLGP